MSQPWPVRVLLLPFACFSAALISPASLAGEVVYEPAVSYVVGRGDESAPVAATVADFNGDGREDIVTANAGSRNISLLPGQAGGTFAAKADTPLGGAPTSLAAGDLNGDGWPDLVATLTNGTLAVLLNTQGAGFQPLPAREVGPKPGSVVVLEYTGDRKPDVALLHDGEHPETGEPFRNQILLLQGDGKGGFIWVDSYGTPQKAFQLAAADFNGDGKDDLVSANANEVLLSELVPSYISYVSDPGDGSVSVFLGNGGGTLAPHGVYPEPAHWITAADFTGDGRPDIATAVRLREDREGPWNSFPYVEVRRGRGDGTFLERQSRFVHWAGALMAGDFDGDGKTDLAVSVGTVDIYKGRGTGVFDSPVFYSNFPRSFGGLATPSPADFNDDGIPDLVGVTDLNQVSVRLSRRQPDALFSATAFFSPLDLTTVYTQQPGTMKGDVNGDGFLDLVVHVVGWGYEQSGLHVLLGQADGTLKHRAGPPNSVRWPETTLDAYGATLADFNGDGRADFLWRDDIRTVKIARAGADGHFATLSAAPVTLEPFFPERKEGERAIHDVAASDFNGDGKPDLLILNYLEVHLLLGNGDLTFRLGGTDRLAPAHGDLGLHWHHRDKIVRDFTGDGVADLMFLNIHGSEPFLPRSVTVVPVDRAGKLQAPVTTMLEFAPGPLEAADFNKDGYLDLVTSGNLLLGQGNGSFRVHGTFPIGEDSPPQNPIRPPYVAEDFNGDGHTDLAAFGDFEVRLLYGDGTGTLRLDPIMIKVGSSPAHDDSDRDSMIAGDYFGGVRILTNVGPKPGGVPGDVNEDSRVDVGDAILVLRIAVDMHEPTEKQNAADDVTQDGAVNVQDAITILRIAVGIPVSG